jgi:hypothetical protein
VTGSDRSLNDIDESSGKLVHQKGVSNGDFGVGFSDTLSSRKEINLLTDLSKTFSELPE